MAEQIEIEIVGFTSLKAQIREATLEFQKLQSSGTATGAEIDKAAAKVGALKDEFADATETAKSLGTAAGKFGAVTKSLSVVAGGFTAIQGAIGLAGGDAKEFEKTMQRVQSAMALSTGLAQLAEMGDSFTNLKKVAVGAFNSIKVAIGSSGVGLLVIGLGAAITALAMNWDELTGAIDEETQAQIEANKVMIAGTASVSKQILSIKYYQSIVNDTTRSEKERILAMKELQRLVPSLTNNDINGANALAAVNAEIEAYINNATLKAQIDALIAKKAENLNKQAEINAQTTEEATKGFINGVKAYLMASETYDEAFQKEMMAIDSKAEATAGLVKENNALDVQLKNLTGSYLKTASAANKYADSAAGAGKEVNKEIEAEQNKLIVLATMAALHKETLAEQVEAADKAFAVKVEGLKKQGFTEVQIAELRDAELEKVRTDFYAKEKEARDKANKEADEANKKAAEDFIKRQEEKYGKALKKTSTFYQREQTDLNNSTLKGREFQRAQEQLNLDRLKRERRDAVQFKKDTSEIDLQISSQTRNTALADADFEKQQRQKTFDYTIASASQLIDSLKQLQDAQMSAELAAVGDNQEAQERIREEYFEKDKNFQYAKASMAAIQGGIQAFTQGMELGGPPLAALFLALSLAATSVQLSAISKTKYVAPTASRPEAKATPSTYAEGGLILGPSHDLGGVKTTMGELEGGEFVMNRRTTANFLPLLASINSLGNTPGPQVASSQQTPIIKTYVVATDMTSQQEANSRLNALARL